MPIYYIGNEIVSKVKRDAELKPIYVSPRGVDGLLVESRYRFGFPRKHKLS